MTRNIPDVLKVSDIALEAIAPPPRWPLSRVTMRVFQLFYLFATLQFLYAYATLAFCYVPLDRYLAGTANLPFQRRVLVMFLLKLLMHSHLHLFTGGTSLLDGVPRIYLLLIDLAGFCIALWFALRLHRTIAPHSRLHVFVYPLLLFSVSWTYLTNYTVNCLYYPWDMLSMAFFTAGIYFIYTRRFYLLVLTVLVGTCNHESTVFLIPLFLLDAAAPFTSLSAALNGLRRVPWLKAFLLTAAWLLVRFILDHFYSNNSRVDDFIRLQFNLRFLNPRIWPQIFGAGGYTFLAVLVLWKRIPDKRLAVYILVLPLWFLTMCFFGVLSETRIYGELCPLVAVCSALLIESYIGQPTQTSPGTPAVSQSHPR